MTTPVDSASDVSWSGLLRRHALNVAGKPAFVTLDGSGEAGYGVTYGELRTAVRCIGSCLADSLPAQSRILILLPQDLSFIKAYVSCLITGMVAVPVYLPANGKHVKKVQGIFADARPQAILWSESSTPRLRSELKACSACAGALWIDIDVAERARERAHPDVGPECLAMLQYTSGSTGDPKGVMLTHRNLLANQEMIQKTFGHTSDTIVVASLPLYHDMGLIGNILQPLYLGATCFFLSPKEVVRQPLSWLRSISRHRATTSGGPNAYYDLCIDRIPASAGLDDLNLSCWTTAFNGSEPIRYATIETFARKFAPCGFQKSAFLPVYGLAEASLLVTGDRRASLPTVARLDRTAYERGRVVEEAAPGERPPVQVVGCGRPAPGVEVDIVGGDRRRLEEREIGEILVRSDSVAEGYWNSAPALTEARWLRTGDLGFLSDGELFVTGRLKESIIIRGRNYYPADIEATATQAFAATAGCRNAAFSLDVDGREEIVLVQEVSRDNAVDHETTRRAISLQCWTEHDIQLYDIVLVRTGTVPRTTSGKTRRLLVKQLYADGELAALDAADAEHRRAQRPGSVPDADRLATCLIDAFRRHVPGARDRIDADTSMSALGLDSYSLVQLSDQLGRLLGVEIPLMAFFRRSTIADLAGHISEHWDSFKPWREASPRTETGGAGSTIRQTHGQIALWNRDKAAHHALASTVSRAVRVSPRLDPDVFRAAVTRLMTRYDLLRTELREEDGTLVQVVVPDRAPSIEQVDATGWTETRVSQYLEDRANTILDVVNGELSRWFLLSRPDGCVVLFTFHHAICDLETISMLLEALFVACSTDAADGIEPAASYADFVERHYELLESEEGRRREQYWVGALQGVDLKLDIVSRKGPRPGLGAGFRELMLPPAATGLLMRKSTEANVGLHVLLLAAFAVTLRRYTHQERFAIGVPISARIHERFRRTLGYMVNVLPVLVDFTAATRLEQVLEQVRESLWLAVEHHEYPLSLLVQQYRRSHAGLVHDLDVLNAVFVYQKAALADGQDATAFAMNRESAAPATIGDLELRSVPVRARDVEFPLKMTAGVIGDSLAIELHWDDGIMYESVMASILDDYGALLRNVA